MMELDLSRKGGEIPALWFGHNLEHTRRALWEGLSAQMVRNRKLSGATEPDGVARRWYRVGPNGHAFMLERVMKRWDMYGEPYTAGFDGPRGMRQRIQRVKGGPACGMGQAGLALQKGRAYEVRVALKGDRELTALVRIIAGRSRPAGRGAAASSDKVRQYASSRVAVGPKGWTEHEFRFAAPARDEDARLEITFSQHGVLYIGAASMLPADHFHGMRRDVVELLKEISVPILRWPGGNFVGAYRWKDGLLPVGRRRPLPAGGVLPYTDGMDDHEIGIDEYIALCRELGAEPWITINIGIEGAAEEARDWVEYCNGPATSPWGRKRAQRGHRGPYKVRYWSLGNEMGYGHMAGPNAPIEYGKAAAACAKAMKKVDPSLVLVGSGAWWKKEWFTETLAMFGEHFDHIAHHEYSTPVKDFEGRAGKDGLKRLTHAPATCSLASLKRVRSRANASAPGRKFVGISFDEWNVWYAWNRVPGVVEGLHAAAMLNMLCREGRKLGLTFGAYFEPVNEGAILVGPTSSRLTPAGEVFRLFRAHHGKELIRLPTQPKTGDLDVAASFDKARNEIALTVINTSPEAAATLEITLGGRRKTKKAAGTLLTSADFGPESSFERKKLPVKVTVRGVAVSVPKHSAALVRIAV